MAPKIPEFILRKMFIQGSLAPRDDGFSFKIKDTYAPATVTGFRLTVDEVEIPLAAIQLQSGDNVPMDAAGISPESPLALPVNEVLHVRVQGHPLGAGRLRIEVDTREAGLLSFTVGSESVPHPSKRYPRGNIFKRLLSIKLQGEAVVDLDDVIGEINPRVYGHFVEHLENTVYGGLFTADGSQMNADVVSLVNALKPAVIRYPGGNFASDYHWEEGIGPKEQRPRHIDRVWHCEDSNQVGTDEFLSFCEAVSAEPYLVVNDGSGTPEEAARWVAYCNAPTETEMGAKRAANGHPAPYQVRLWGLGNEVWGDWQIGHTDAAGYVRRIRPFIEAMRAVDPSIELVAVGLDMLEDDPLHAEDWNRTVLEGIGNQIQFLSFHVYQPSEEGYQETYDPETLYHNIVSAPHSTEEAIQKMAELIAEVVPDRQIGVALDEYNVKLPPPAGARSMHDLTYTLRDGLYIAGMLNAFHRQCATLQLANVALLVNTLPVIVKPEDGPAFPTPLYFPFKLYSLMETQALAVTHWSPFFQAEGLGLNISPKSQVPYLDLTATRAADGSRLVLGIINRNPLRKAKLMLFLKGEGSQDYHTTGAWLMSGPDPLAANTTETPDRVGVREVKAPTVRFGWLDLELPPASLMVVTLEKRKKD